MKSQKFNIIILIISAVGTFLQSLILGLNSLTEINTLWFQIIMILLSATATTFQTVQISLKSLKSRLSTPEVNTPKIENFEIVEN